MTPELPAQTPQQSRIVLHATGTDAVDLDLLYARGITLTSLPDYATIAVAEHALGLLMTLALRIHLGNDVSRGIAAAETSLRGIELHVLPVSPHPHLERGEPAQRRHAALCPALLNGTENGIEHHHCQNDERIAAMAEWKSHGRRRQQQIDERTCELPQKHRPQRPRRRFRQRIRSILRRARCHFTVTQTPGGVHLELGRRFLTCQDVPRDGG